MILLLKLLSLTRCYDSPRKPVPENTQSCLLKDGDKLNLAKSNKVWYYLVTASLRVKEINIEVIRLLFFFPLLSFSLVNLATLGRNVYLFEILLIEFFLFFFVDRDSFCYVD